MAAEPGEPPALSPRSYRVLLVNLARRFGGAETHVVLLAKALQSLTAACTVATLDGSMLHHTLQVEGLPFEAISGSRASPRLLFALRRLIRDQRYHIVDAHNIQSLFWGHAAATLARSRGRVATIQSDWGVEYANLKGRLYGDVLALYRPLVREFIYVTEVLQTKAEARGDSPRSTLIHNAVPVPTTPLQVKNVRLLRRWGYTPDDFVVAVVARFDEVKGHTYLIEALSMLRDQPHVKLLLVGEGPLRSALERQAANSGVQHRVHFCGFRHDVPTILQAVDAVCLPSVWEALPHALLEAAAYARPILATTVGGVQTTFENGTSAVLVAPRNPRSLADGIRWLVEQPDEARRIGLAAYDVVWQSYSVDAMVAKTLHVYDRALR